MAEAAKLVRFYESGLLTRQELLFRLCQSAFYPDQLVADIPSDVLSELRMRFATPPATPEKCRVFGSVCADYEFDAERHFDEESRQLNDCLWRWYRYFATAPESASEGS